MISKSNTLTEKPTELLGPMAIPNQIVEAKPSSSNGKIKEMNFILKEKPHNKHLEDSFGVYIEQEVLKKYSGEKCSLEVAYPPNWDFEKERKDKQKVNSVEVIKKPAKEYPFQLDDFQIQSIACIERKESLLVSAHTSAGKTVVAEYAIASCLRDNQRCIYTSPIKALSNQKYRELYEEFQDVGLMTGDVVISPNASCLVMTTEILRNMLYRGNEMMREMGWIIFDEIHYMTNKSRGVIWEESIILLPNTIRLIFLSATVPNGTEFALWVAKLRKQPCNVVSTEHRPTPLQHYVFPSGGEGLYLVVDENGVFKENNFSQAMTSASNDPLFNTADKKSKSSQKRKKKTTNDMYKVVKMIIEKHYNPVIIFSFSKKDCEKNALSMAKLDFCNVDEKTMISRIFSNAMDSLSTHDRNLPQVQGIIPILKRGIGMHHSGLLPIVKEVVEILFQEGLIKALFATETFSMGLNMPAKTVVFTNIFKFDGTDHRNLTSGEYIQMCGRAGRRGKDERGIVVLMMDPQRSMIVKNMMQGEPDRLVSAFYLDYNMLLNLLLVEDSHPEYLLIRSFYQFQRNRTVPKLIAQVKKLEEKKNVLQFKKNVNEIAEYYHIKQTLTDIQRDIHNVLVDPLNIVPFLNPGRLIKVVNEDVNWHWGIVLNFQKKKIPTKQDRSKNNALSSFQTAYVIKAQYVVDCLLRCDTTNKKKGIAHKLKPCPPGVQGEMKTIPILLHCIAEISQIRLYINRDMRSSENRNYVGACLKEAQRRHSNGFPLLDPVEDMKIKDPSFLKLMRKAESLEDRIKASPLHQDVTREEQCKLYKKSLEINKQISTINQELNNVTHDIELRRTLKKMKRVLRHLGMTSKNDIVLVKGRFACELSSCDELMGTELMFSGIFTDLTVNQLVSLCSCLVLRHTYSDFIKDLSPELVKLYQDLRHTAKRIAEVIKECKISLEVEDYVNSFRCELMHVVYSWCEGAHFKKICKMTKIYEGTIIRIMRLVDQVLQEFSTASKAIGNTTLEKKFLEGREKLKRDIVFAASLYL